MALPPLAGDVFEGSVDCCAVTPQTPITAANVAAKKILDIRNIGDSLPNSIANLMLDVNELEAVVAFV